MIIQPNLLTAIVYLINSIDQTSYNISYLLNLRNSDTANRMNQMGSALEEFIKDIFTQTLTQRNEEDRNKQLATIFSYLGNQNNPPDMILRGADAIEVKKLNTFAQTLALNSSYPKAKLLANSSMITDIARRCEEWQSKDLLYCVGVITNNALRSLSFVYGVDYAADATIYERVAASLKNGLYDIPDIELAPTLELARVNRVDPLGITSLRVRGMWQITTPLKLFGYLYERDRQTNFDIVAIINTQKYLSFSNESRIALEHLSTINKNLTIRDVEIKDPNNPANLKSAKLITYVI